MSKSHHRGAGKAVLASLTGLALAGSMWTPALAVESPSPKDPTAEGIASATIDAKLKVSEDLRAKTGVVSVYIQFTGKGAFERTQPLKVRLGDAEPQDKVAEVKSIRAEIEGKAQEVTKAAGATHIYTTTNTIPGVGITGDAAKIRELAQRPDVVKISGIIPKTYDNKGAVQDTRALDSWIEREMTGEGVTIAVLDTGLDYTHADFGGPGTIEAFQQAQAAEAEAPDPSLYDADKYAGGWDLVGDDYNADPSAESYQPIPKPDPNPLDCQSHGSHVAGTAAGYGVNADGTTVEGDYSTLTGDAVNGMKIGPGTAPNAKLVSIRVFGCEGSSSVVGQALDFVLDPNDDGDFSDRAQVVNMSLGSSFSTYDDPEIDIVNSLTSQGVLSVISSGNDGDIYDIGGAPGSAASALTVANSVGSQITLDRAEILAPSDVAGPASGQYSANFDYTKASEEALNGTVVLAPEANRFGCDAFDEGSLTGKWVWIQWEEDGDFPCGSKQRFDNAEKAGAEGVVLDSPRSVFAAGIAGNATIPGVQFTNTFSDKLRPAAEAGTLEVQLDADYIATGTSESGALDTLNASSSRGIHGSNGVVKPDIAAPGTSIGSAASGSGNGASVKTGTSMAAPHVAGIAALVVGATTLNPYEVKSIVMNTATHDLLTADGVPYGPNRVGTGRVDALNALNSPVLAYATEDKALTSVNFGLVELGAKKATITKAITVENKSDTVRTYTAEYLAATTMPGVTVTVASATGTNSVQVPANATATVNVTLTIADPAALVKTIDPAAEVTQLGVPRQYLADVSGRVQLTSDGIPALRVPVYSAPQPTSEMSAGAKVTFNPGSDQSSVVLTGRDLNQGGGSQAYLSKVSPLVLGAESPRSETLSLDSLHKLDLRSVGASSTVPAIKAASGNVKNAALNFGVSTWDNWPTLGANSYITVELETTGDEKADFRLVTGRADGLDLIIVETYKVNADGSTGDYVEGTQTFANGALGNTDTNTFDTNVVTLPMPLAPLGLDLSKSAPVQYKVITEHPLNVDQDGNNVPVDSTDWINFNATQPALWFQGAAGSEADSLFTDLDGQTLRVNRQPGVDGGSLLFLHHHNAEGVKDEVVPTENGELRFSDVPDSLMFSEDINWMADQGLTTGYPDGTYRPLGNINRDAMAAFLYRLAGEPAFDAPTASPFKDISLKTKFYKEMTWMESEGLTEGYSDGTYRPLAPVNRDAMAAFMNRFAAEVCSIEAAAEYEAPNTKPFTDVAVNSQFHREISWLKSVGVTTGYPDGSYHQVEAVHRDAMAAFIHRLSDNVTGDCGL